MRPAGHDLSENPSDPQPLAGAYAATHGAGGGGSLRSRAVKSIAAFGFQQVLTAALTFGAGVLLARLLTPQELGTYGILSFVLLLAATLADLSVGQALIQQPTEPSPSDLRTAFTIQFFAALAIGGLCALLAPSLARAYGLGAPGARILWVLLVSLGALPFRTMATVRWERSVTFGRVAAADFAEQVCFYGTAVGLAFYGMGTWALGWGLLAGRAAGLLVLLRRQPGLVRLRFSRGAAASLLRRGLAFQLGTLIVLVRDAVVPVFLGLWAGATAVGYLNWAVGLMFFPLAAVQITGRVLFAAFARRQGDLSALRAGLQQALDLLLMALASWAFACVVFREPLVTFVFGLRWRPAIAALPWLVPAVVLGGATNLFLSFLKGVGRARIAVRVLVLWTVIFWVTGMMGAVRFGFVGVAVAAGLASGIVAVAHHEVQRVVRVRLWGRCLRWIGAGLLLWTPAHWLAARADGWPGTLGALAGTAVACAVLGSLMAGQETWVAIAQIVGDLRGLSSGSREPDQGQKDG